MNYGLPFKPIKHIKIILETVNRIGIKNNKLRVLRPSCYVFEDGETYRLCHFKEMMLHENSDAHVSEIDYRRRNLTFHLLTEWELIVPLCELDKYADNGANVAVLSKEMLKTWKIKPLYFPIR